MLPEEYERVGDKTHYVVSDVVIPCYKFVYYGEIVYISIADIENDDFYPNEIPIYKDLTNFLNKTLADKCLLQRNIENTEKCIKELIKQLGKYYLILEQESY